MRIASLSFLTLVSISCGPRAEAPPYRVAHPLTGQWTLRSVEHRSGIRLEIRVDSVARDSAYGALTFYMAGNAGFLVPEDWGPLVGTVRADTARLVVGAGARAPAIGLHGVVGRDTVRLSAMWIGADTLPGPSVLVRTTASPP